MTNNMSAISAIVAEIIDLCNEAKVDEYVHCGPIAIYKPSFIVTILILKNLFGFNSERSFLRYLAKHHKQDFPCLPEQSWFNRKAKRLLSTERMIHQVLLKKLGATKITIRIVDTTPIPIVKIWRAKKCKIFKRKTEVNYGYCASKKLYYYGEKLTLVTTPTGIQIAYVLTPANMHDVKALKNNLEHIPLKGKILVADKGYYDGELETMLKVSHETTLVVPEKKRHQKKNTDAEKKLLKGRGIIETVNNQLQEQMNIDETLAKTHEGLVSRIQAAILSFTFGIYHNCVNHRPQLALKSVMT